MHPVISILRWKAHCLISPSTPNPVFSSFPSPRMHWASACSSFYGCVFHRHFYCHRQTIKVCWTHACCPSAGCGSIKSIFLWKWVAISGGGVEADKRNLLRSGFYPELYKIRDPTASHPKQVSFDLQTEPKCSLMLLSFFSCITSELRQHEGQCRACARTYSLFP